jgi:cytidylate kinase
MRRIVVAVDGPAGAGKSTASRALAERLGYAYVDTGAMYRAVGVVAHERGVGLDDDAALARLMAGLRFELCDGGAGLAVDGADMSQAIRRADAGDLASRVSTRPVVRERLVALQRSLGASGGVVMEGRDIGTVVFPAADVKIYLDASPEERARRRAADPSHAASQQAVLAEIATALAERDRSDATRAVSPLLRAVDALAIDTTSMPVERVIAEIVTLVNTRRNAVK